MSALPGQGGAAPGKSFRQRAKEAAGPFFMALVVGGVGGAALWEGIKSGGSAVVQRGPRSELRATVQDYFRGLLRDQPGEQFLHKPAAKYLFSKNLEGDRYLNAYLVLGKDVDPNGRSGTVPVDYLVTVRARSGCRYYSGGSITLVKSGRNWMISSVQDLVDSERPCDCDVVPWPSTPTGQSDEDPVHTNVPNRGRYRRVSDLNAHARLGAPGAWNLASNEILDGDPQTRPRWLVSGSYADFRLRRRGSSAPLAPACMAFDLTAPDGPRPRPPWQAGPRVQSLLVKTHSADHERTIAIALQDMDGVQWRTDNFTRSPYVKVEIESVMPPGSAVLPPLEVSIWERQAGARPYRLASG